MTVTFARALIVATVHSNKKFEVCAVVSAVAAGPASAVRPAGIFQGRVLRPTTRNRPPTAFSRTLFDCTPDAPPGGYEYCVDDQYYYAEYIGNELGSACLMVWVSYFDCIADLECDEFTGPADAECQNALASGITTQCL